MIFFFFFCICFLRVYLSQWLESLFEEQTKSTKVNNPVSVSSSHHPEVTASQTSPTFPLSWRRESQSTYFHFMITAPTIFCSQLRQRVKVWNNFDTIFFFFVSQICLRLSNFFFLAQTVSAISSLLFCPLQKVTAND